MLRVALASALCGTFICGVSAPADDGDAIAARLDAAMAEYDKGAEALRGELLAALTRKEDAAKAAGDLKTVEKVRAEVGALLWTGALPKAVPTAAHERGMKALRAKLAGAYAAARKAYTQAGLIEQAKAVDKLLDELKKIDAPPERAAVALAPRKVIEFAKKESSKTLLADLSAAADEITPPARHQPLVAAFKAELVKFKALFEKVAGGDEKAVKPLAEQLAVLDAYAGVKPNDYGKLDVLGRNGKRHLDAVKAKLDDLRAGCVGK